jgi:hypothetical protein
MKLHMRCLFAVAILAMAVLCACHSEEKKAEDKSPPPHAVNPPVQNINREIIIVMPPATHVQDGRAAGSQHKVVLP